MNPKEAMDLDLLNDELEQMQCKAMLVIQKLLSTNAHSFIFLSRPFLAN